MTEQKEVHFFCPYCDAEITEAYPSAEFAA